MPFLLTPTEQTRRGTAYNFLIPYGYGTRYVTVEELIPLAFSGIEPEAGLRHLNYIISRKGLLGIGGGVRPCPSNTSQASRECKSFHQRQTFLRRHDGETLSPRQIWWTAFDYVRSNPDRSKPHLTCKTGDLPVQGTEEATVWGIWANVGTPGQAGWEPWHGQPVFEDGFDSWEANGRRLPEPNYPYPNHLGPSPTPKPPTPITKTRTPMRTLHPVQPYARVFDTRGLGGPMPGQAQYGVAPLAGNPALGIPIPPDNIGSIVGVQVQVTVVPTVDEDPVPGYATIWPGDYPAPNVSQINYVPGGQPIATLAEPSLAADGTFKIFISEDAGIFVDLLGYYTA